MNNENTESELQLLEKFIHENAELERLEQISKEFNIFAALKIINNEIRHSNFLAWILDPNENHGLGDYVLRLFLKQAAKNATETDTKCPSIFDIDSCELNDAEVLREWNNIDVLIRNDEAQMVCIIENKIYSGEASGQLARYKRIIEREFPRYEQMYVYLTIEGETPSESDYISMCYDDVLQILEYLLESKQNALGQDVLVFITNYTKMLRRYVMKNSEIQEICKKIYKSHSKALDLIYEYKPDIFMKIHDIIMKLLGSETDINLEVSSKSYIRFIPKQLDNIPMKGNNWPKSGRMMYFVIENNKNGLTISLIMAPGPKEIRDKLYTIAKSNPQPFNKAKRQLSDGWMTIYRKSWIKPKVIVESDEEVIEQMVADKFSKFKEADMKEIESLLRGIDFSQNID